MRDIDRSDGVPLAINQPANSAVAVDSTHVYWATEGVEAGYADSKVFRIPK